MTAYVLQLIPTDMRFIPTLDLQRRAADYLFSIVGGVGRPLDDFPSMGNVEFKEHEKVQCVSAWANEQWIICPSCRTRTESSVEGLESLGGRRFERLWRETWSATEKSGCDGLTILMPCCGRRVKLTDMKFDSPGSFARFVIEIDNQRGLNPDQLLGLGEILQCEMLQVRASY